MNEKKPQISVIVCVLSLSDEIIKCLNSIATQTYRNFELIIVYKFKFIPDSVVREMFDKSIEIRTILQQHGKLSDARNLGIESSKGLYITFVDGDDVITPQHFKCLIEKTDEDDVDAVFSLPDLIGDFSKEQRNYFYKQKPGIYNSDLNFVISSSVVVWGKLFRRDIVVKYNIRFPVNVIFEDNYFHWAYLSVAKKVRITNDKTYVYICNESSLMNSLKGKCIDEGLDNIKVLEKIVDFLLINRKKEYLSYKLFRKYYWDATKFIQEKYYCHRDKLMTAVLSKLSAKERLVLLINLLFRGIPNKGKIVFCLKAFMKESNHLGK